MSRMRPGSYSEEDQWKPCASSITMRPTAGWAESPDVEGWFAAAGTYGEVVKLAEDGVPFALGHSAELEHCAPAGKHVAA